MYITLALSWLADCCFLIRHRGEHFFEFGLIMFNFAHLCYIYLFFMDCLYPAKKDFSFWEHMGINLIYSGGCVLLCGYLFPYMGNLGKWIFFYALSVCIMCRITWIRHGRIFHLSFLFVVVGANFFFVSDILVMLNKFAFIKFPHMDQIILFAYCVGQFLIVVEIIEGNKKGKSKKEWW